MKLFPKPMRLFAALGSFVPSVWSWNAVFDGSEKYESAGVSPLILVAFCRMVQSRSGRKK